MSLPHIAAKLAAALENMPCQCVTTGTWPRFANVKAHPERKCARCSALEQYAAYKQVVQDTDTAWEERKGEVITKDERRRYALYLRGLRAYRRFQQEALGFMNDRRCDAQHEDCAAVYGCLRIRGHKGRHHGPYNLKWW